MLAEVAREFADLVQAFLAKIEAVRPSCNETDNCHCENKIGNLSTL